MSLSCFVLCNRHLTTLGEWQAAIGALGFAVKLDAEAAERIADLGGHLPTIWEGREAGFECYPGGADQAADLTETSDDVDFGGPWACILEFNYVGFANIAGVTIAAAAYAKATDGVFYEGESGELFGAEAAVAFARKTEAEIRDSLTKQPA